MSAAHESPDELARLFSALEDGTLDPADEARLAELLKAGPEARARYYDHAMLSALLRREGRRAAAQSDEPAVTPRVVTVFTGRRRWWGIALAATILLMLALSVGEATGVTQVVPTIVRIVTGEGALVIEVDDPSVSVTLDGEDVTIKGAGIHELRLRPGTHKIVATKDGQPVREEVVTIRHGGRQVVKVTREANTQGPAAELTASEKLDLAMKDWDEAVQLHDQAQKKLNADPLEAERCMRRALAIFERLDKDYPGAPKFRGRLGPARWLLAASLNMQAHQIIFQNPPPTGAEAARAIALAKEATTVCPEGKEWLANLGRAYYRAGDWNNAKTTLEQSIASGRSTTAEQCFLAMAQWQLGDKELARRTLEDARRSLAEKPTRDRYVAHAAAEASTLIGSESDGTGKTNW